MFVTIVLILLGALLLIVLRDGIRSQLFQKTRFKIISKKIARHIVLNEWQEAERELSLLKGRGDTLLLEIQVLRGTERFVEALALTEGDSCFLKERGKILLSLGRYEEAYEVFSQKEINFHGEGDFFDFARAAYSVGKIDESWDIIKVFLQETRNGSLLILGGDLLCAKREWEGAIDLYQKAMTLGETYADVMAKLGETFRSIGDLQKAESYFHEVLSKDSGHIAATIGLSDCLQERGLYHKALFVLQSGKAWEKKDPTLLFRAGQLALHTSRFSHAIYYFEEVIEKEGDSPSLLAHYGYALEREEKWAEAEEIYLNLLNKFPSHPNGYLGLGWLFGVGLSQKLESKTALDIAYRAVQLDPKSLTWEIVSACEARAGNFDRAHEILECLVAQEKDSFERKRRVEAMRHLRKHLPLQDHHIQRTLVA